MMAKNKPEIHFTEHAKMRMQKRGIIESEVIDSIHYPDSQTNEEDKVKYTRHLPRGKIEVVTQKTHKTLNVITVYWL